jgi:hypothetical protein
MAFAVAYTTLAAAVASPAGTVTLAYPSGFTQAMFTGANASGTAYLLRNDNDRFEEVDDEFDIVYNASDFTVTNKTDLTWAIGDTLTINIAGNYNSTIASTAGVQTLSFPIQLAAMTTAAADLMTNYVPGFAFEVLAVEFVTTTIGAGAGATMALNLEIGTTNLTGGVVTVTLAGTDTLGEKTAGTAITAANIGTAADTLSIEVAASGTIFTAGAGVLLVKVRNLDTYNALVSLATTLARY